MTVHQEIL